MQVPQPQKTRRALLWLIGFSVFAITTGFGSCSNNVILPTFGPVQLSPSTLTFGCLSSPQPFVATQVNFSGTFQAQSNNMAVATVAATSPPGTFVVTSQTSATASTTITVTGGGGITGTENVSVQGCPCVRHRDMWLEK
jgi:hypothetical protein